MEERHVFVGIDVSKKQLDVAFRPRERLSACSTTGAVSRNLARQLEKLGPVQVVVEPTGGF